MTALWLFLGGVLTFVAGASVAAMSVLDTSGRWRVRVLGAVAAVAAGVGLLMIVRAFGFGYVGAP